MTDLDEQLVADLMADIADDVTQLEYLDSAMDEEKAEWVLNKMAGWRDEMVRRQSAHDAAMRRLGNFVQWFQMKYGAPLEEFLRQKLAASGGKAKSYYSPSGVKLKLQQTKGKLGVLDAADALAWARKRGMVRIEEELNKDALTKHFGETGDLPDGMTWVDPGVKFVIDLPSVPALTWNKTELTEEA